jgi:hypothetical protein
VSPRPCHVTEAVRRLLSCFTPSVRPAAITSWSQNHGTCFSDQQSADHIHSGSTARPPISPLSFDFLVTTSLCLVHISKPVHKSSCCLGSRDSSLLPLYPPLPPSPTLAVCGTWKAQLTLAHCGSQREDIRYEQLVAQPAVTRQDVSQGRGCLLR